MSDTNDFPRPVEELLNEEFGVNIPRQIDTVSVKTVNTGSNNFGKLNFISWRDNIKTNFPSLVLAAEVGMSMFGQLLIKDITNPCAIVLTDVPSAGKTIVLNMFSGLKYSYVTDNFTPSSFVSQAANVKKDLLKEVDLLPKIKDKVLIIRDLAPLFGQRDDDLLRNMGVLTRVMDGEGLKLDAGVHGQRGYEGSYNFMLLAASTPISPRIFKLMGNLGSRLFFLNIQSKRKDENTLVEQLVTTSWKVKQQECSLATNKYIAQMNEKYPQGVEWNKAQDPEECIRIIARCASLLAKLRGTINIWKDNSAEGEYSHQEPIIEMPDRISQILYNLARGHALICERTNLSGDDLKTIINVAFDSAPGSRTKVFRLLIQNGGHLNTSQIIDVLNCSDTTALKEMEVLKILGIAEIDTEIGGVGRSQKSLTLKAEYEWFISDECKRLLGEMEFTL